MTETLKFNVKDKSLQTFFNIQNDPRRDLRDEFSPYHLMKDEIILPKRPELQPGMEVIFELADTTYGSRKELTNVYLYSVQDYDDVSVKLALQDFKISVK